MTPSFGIGGRPDWANRNKTPGPGSYRQPSDFGYVTLKGENANGTNRAEIIKTMELKTRKIRIKGTLADRTSRNDGAGNQTERQKHSPELVYRNKTAGSIRFVSTSNFNPFIASERQRRARSSQLS